MLDNIRASSIEILDALKRSHLSSVVHGSVARGDINLKSDIDVFIPEVVSSFIIETALDRAQVQINRRMLIQATPTYSIKGYIEIDDRRSISFPISRLRKTEREFYRFGGVATLHQLRNKIRTIGVDKRLMLVEPTDFGHIESSIIGKNENVARQLSISVETVQERVRTLTRRDRLGRTGLFLEKELLPYDTFESLLRRIAKEKPSVRRRLRTV